MGIGNKEYKKYQEKLEALKDIVSGEMATCSACEDKYPADVARELTGDKCPDCYAEIHFGIIPKEPPKLIFSGHRNGIRRGDEDPSFEDVVRKLENSGN